MWERLDPEAQKAVFLAQEAARRRGEREVTPEHLLLALLAPGASASLPLVQALGVERQVLEAMRASLAISPDWRGLAPLEEMRLTQDTLSVIQRAWQEGATLGGGPISAEHLLLGLAAQEGMAAAAVLHRHGVETAKLRGHLEQRLPDGAAPPEPAAPPVDPDRVYRIIPGSVAGASLLFFLQGAFGAMWLLLGILGGLRRFASLTVPFLLTAGWLAVFGLGISGGLLRRRRWAWSAAAGRLFVDSAVVTALLLWTGGRPERLASDTGFLWTLWYEVLILALSVALFQSRSWFEIEERRGWGTLLREGGWALLTTACVELPWLVVWVTSRS